jgi:tripartite-type tricarboxylate transporter receptor subunit TctC
MTHVPFKGTGESVPALLGGHIEVLFSAYPSLSGAAGGNQVKLLATNGAERSAQAPNLPSLAEFIPGFDFAPVIGIFARSGTPHAVVQKLAAEALATVKEPDVIKQLGVVGVEPAGAGPQDFAAVLQGETRRVAAAVDAAGIKAK